MSRPVLALRPAGCQVGTPGGPARLIACCRSSAHPFLRAQLAQGGSAHSQLQGRPCPRKPQPVRQVALWHQPLTFAQWTPGKPQMLSCPAALKSLPSSRGWGPECWRAREESPWERATALAGGSESQGQLNWTLAQLIPSAPPQDPEACHSSPAAVQPVIWEASHSSLWTSVSPFVV